MHEGMSSAQIRHAFLTYFSQHGHQEVASSSLVPHDDPTLLFTNAGMVQFKDTFLGTENRPYGCAVSVQRCLRAGGKHNDLDNVGYTARHHTFFEMLGNFSFGTYFKREAIRYAWEFLTEVLKIPKERLWVTVHESDDDAMALWRDDIGVATDRISRCGDADNFWSMGDTGPCGPCSEIFYDHGESVPGGPPGTALADGDRYVEIWNLVFMQYNRDKSGALHPLPRTAVDTGMGLERLVAVMQGVHNNYYTDLFMPVIRAILAVLGDASGVTFEHPSLKVMADHLRASSFLIVDGIVPSNEGRGYVLRRIIRRAVRHAHQLGLSSIAQFLPALVQVMGAAYPTLLENQSRVAEVLLREEQQFARTLEQGLVLLKHDMQQVVGTEIPGDVVFKLYDTYGFPVDLTADIAREHGFGIDLPGFETHMKKQREQSQSASAFGRDYHHGVPVSASCHVSLFDGYAHDALDSQVMGIFQDGVNVVSANVGMRCAVVLDATPFYPESGGQVGDQGVLVAGDGAVTFRVDDTQRVGEMIVHEGEVLAGEFQQGLMVRAEISRPRRDAIRLNHSATHLLHAALKLILGPHVQQKGSLVEAERARFDFSHHSPLTAAQLDDIETLLNAKIRQNAVIDTSIMSRDEALQAGALGLFGEKYGESVRVLSMGDFSMELCGGTHASRTGDLGLFLCVAEYGVASGVRRMEFMTGQHALDWMRQRMKALAQVAGLFKTTPSEIVTKVEQHLGETCDRDRALVTAQQQLMMHTCHALLSEVRHVAGVALLVKRFDRMDVHQLRTLFDQLRSHQSDAVIVLVAVNLQKMHVVVGVAKSLLAKVPSAAMLIRHVCGRGGGRDDMAQGGGELPHDLDEKLQAIDQLIAHHVTAD